MNELSQKDMAAEIGISVQALRKAARTGRAVISRREGRRVFYDVEATLKKYRSGTDPAMQRGRKKPRAKAKTARQADTAPAPAHMTDMAAGEGGAPDDDGEKYQKARAKKEDANAELAKLKLREKQSELVKKDEVLATVFDIFRTVRDQLQAAPSRMAPFVDESDMAAVSDMFHEIIVDMQKSVEDLKE